MELLRIPSRFVDIFTKFTWRSGEAFSGGTTIASRDWCFFLSSSSSPPCFQHHRFLFTHIDYLCCYSLFTPPRKLQMLLYCAG